MPKTSTENYAFPQPVAISQIDHVEHAAADTEGMGGMLLRDYFAAKAMQSCFAGEGARNVANRDARYDETNWAEVVAANAYEMADAMMKAREGC